MQIDPITADLFTDAGRFLKRLSCPRQVLWEQMPPTSDNSRNCSECSRPVHDTSLMTDDDLVGLLEKDPSACLMLSFKQDNCTVVPLGMRKENDFLNALQ